jgi:GNAT superfamily N-acetyltransferase
VIAPQRDGSRSNDRSFRIESARPEHVAQIHGLVAGLAMYEHMAELCVASERDLADALFGKPSVAEALVATIEGNSGQAAGFALFFHTYSTFLGRRTLWLEDLYVRPEHRGRGLGEAFLRRLARLAVERNCGRFEWAVLDWNASAIAFYESLGARVLPDWRIARMTGASLADLANASSTSASIDDAGR